MYGVLLLMGKWAQGGEDLHRVRAGLCHIEGQHEALDVFVPGALPHAHCLQGRVRVCVCVCGCVGGGSRRHIRPRPCHGGV